MSPTRSLRAQSWPGVKWGLLPRSTSYDGIDVHAIVSLRRRPSANAFVVGVYGSEPVKNEYFHSVSGMPSSITLFVVG